MRPIDVEFDLNQIIGSLRRVHDAKIKDHIDMDPYEAELNEIHDILCRINNKGYL